MNDELKSKKQLRAYLFGELDEAVAEQLEEKCFVESDWQLALLAERDDLLDEWACGELSVSEVAQLEARLTELPALREHAAFARSLHQHFTQPIAPSMVPSAAPLVSTWRERFMNWGNLWPLAAATATVVLLAGSWLVWNALRSRQTAPVIAQQPLPAATPEASPEAAPAREKAKPAVRQTPEHNPKEPEIASFVLAAATLRSADNLAPTLAIPARAHTLRLQLELPSEAFAPQFAVLQNTAGEIIRQQSSLRVLKDGAMRYVVCEVPVALLTEGAYQLHISGHISPADSSEAVYLFTAQKSSADR
jgi:hypothetical protein